MPKRLSPSNPSHKLIDLSSAYAQTPLGVLTPGLDDDLGRNIPPKDDGELRHVPLSPCPRVPRAPGP